MGGLVRGGNKTQWSKKIIGENLRGKKKTTDFVGKDFADFRRFETRKFELTEEDVFGGMVSTTLNNFLN